MTTPEPPRPPVGGASPTELDLGALLVPDTPASPATAASLVSALGPTTATTTPSAGAPTPGVALAAARMPGAPAVADLDPIALVPMLGAIANELFAALPGTTTGMGVTPAATAGSVVSPTSTPPQPSVPSTPHASGDALSPFAAPLALDGLGALPGSETFTTIALIDPRGPGLPGVATPERLAFDALPGSTADSAPVAESIVVEPYEIQPVGGEAVRAIGPGPFDPHAIRAQFPILRERVHGKRLVWLDNAATTQKPQAVIDRLVRYYTHENSNIHRAAHTLAARATDAYESARESVRRFIGAGSVSEIVFVRGATEGINLVAQAWGRRNIEAGDEIVITWLEHHANIVPWQMLCTERGARLRVAPVDDHGQIVLEAYERLLGPRTRIVALPQVSNALGTITPAAEMIELAHRHGAKVLLDGAQAVSHMPVDVRALDCDFYVFSGHKVFAPTGIGVVYGKREVLEAMPPWQGGGNMIRDVTFERTSYQDPPARFEAGTGNIADAVGLGAALDWLHGVGLPAVERYEHDLLAYATAALATVPGLRMIGTAPAKAGVLSFVLAGHRTEEVGELLDREGIAVRSGHHCAQPILRRFGLEATVRASLAPYNTCEDIDALVAALLRLQAAVVPQP